IKELSIKTPSSKELIKNLSGGNQQKVIISRWLAKEPDVLIMDEPTRGIDVGAKYEIYSIIGRLASEGKTIIVVSSEMPELIGICDRIMVMCEGRITGIVEGEDMNQEKIMELSTKFRS
ncbi:MAG: sugar ABC transporter ATP-binding protein, partial [Erysipelotrichaceae bacterium]|nr:sugar ABC transporter ATP-binding protein [Erysipelotrichaceae bacterium]